MKKQSVDDKLKEIYSNIARQMGTDAMLHVLIYKEVTTYKLFKAVKTKILNFN